MNRPQFQLPSSEHYTDFDPNTLCSRPADVLSEMFSPVQEEWEENFQDLSGWCIPTISATKPVCIAAPVDLNTPDIEPGCDELRLNINLAKAVPRFIQEPENDAGVWSPLKESSFLNLWLPKTYPQSFDMEASPLNTDDHSKENEPKIAQETLQEDQNVLASRSTFSTDVLKGSFLEKNSQPKPTTKSCVDDEANKNLSVRKRKLKLNVSNNVTLNANELTTPNIVQMLVATPPLVNDVPQPTDDFEVANDFIDVDCPDGLLPPLDELGTGFDLLAYMMEEVPKPEPCTFGIQTIIAEENSLGVDKLACLKSTRCSDSAVDVAPRDLALDVDQPCTSRGRRGNGPIVQHMQVISPVEDLIKIELEPESDEDYACQSNKQSKRRKTKPAVPRKRSRRSTSSSSQQTSASNVSEAGSDNKYRELRDRNNEASKRSRHNRKLRDGEMSVEASRLEKENRTLKIKADEMERLVKQLRESLLQTITKTKAK